MNMANFHIYFHYLVQSHSVKFDRLCVLSKFEVNITHIDLKFNGSIVI